MIGLLIAAASFGFIDGNKLLQLCDVRSGDDAVICDTYLAGVGDTATWIGPGVSREEKFCPRPNVTRKQLFDVPVASLKAHPETRDFPAPMLVLRAWARAFPCPK